MSRVTRAGGSTRQTGRDGLVAPAPEPLRIRLGRAVRRLREAAGHASQEAFADAAGVHRTYAGKVERGELNVSLDSLERLARALGVSPGELLVAAERAAGEPTTAASPARGGTGPTREAPAGR